jgi:hypothetical protein
MLVLISNQVFGMNFFGGLSLADSIGTSSISTESDAPKVNILNAGVSLGGEFFGFILLGAHSSYSIINQTSEPAASTGNRRGIRSVPVAPLIGFNFSFARLQADYQTSGDYLLTNADILGNKIIYKKPTGMGIEFVFKISSWTGFGIRYEKVEFSQEKIGTANATDLTNKLTLKSYGVVFNVFF